VDVAVGAGPLATLRARARAATALDGGHAGGFVDLGTTRGDFVFRHDDTLGTGGPLDVRRNNDHRRANAALFAALGGGASVVDVAGVIGAHEGGVPGFATAPLDLRAREATAAAGARWTLRGEGARLSLVVDGTGSDRSVRSSTLDSRLVGARAGGGLVAVVPLVERLQASLDVRVERSGVLDAVDRTGGHAAFGLAWSAPLAAIASELRLDARGRLGVVDDDDRALVAAHQTLWLPAGHARATVVHDALAAFVGVTRTARAPTLDERFAPQGFVRGNPALRPEAVAEIEGGVAVESPRAGARVVAHASDLDDVIVPVNRNAFEVVPENTGRAQRAGLDARATLRPTPLVEVTLAASVLATALVPATTTAPLPGAPPPPGAAPLPGAPPVTFALVPRLGTADAWLRTTIAARGPVSSNLFGTVTSPGSVLVDLDARLPVGRNIGLALFVQNAFDVLDARDQNLLPLPGRLVFVSLELHA
jgi:hypothetical protein